MQRVAAGGTALDREVVSALIADRDRGGDEAELGALTAARARDAGADRRRAGPTRRIAREMVVTLGAVEKHVSNIFAKLDLPAGDDDHRRVLAVLAYLRATAPQ